MTPPAGESRFEGPGADDIAVTPIGDAMSSLLRSRGLGSTVTFARICGVWEEAVGDELAKRVTPVAFRHGELVCQVDDPSWATQLRLLSGQIVGRLADELGSSTVERLSVQVRASSRPRKSGR